MQEAAVVISRLAGATASSRLRTFPVSVRVLKHTGVGVCDKSI
jgi:hypothetical protein